MKVKQPTLRQPNIDEQGLAMNEICVMLSNTESMNYDRIQTYFDFVVSGVLLEMQLAGLIKQKYYNCFMVV